MLNSKIDIHDKKTTSFGISTVPAGSAGYSINDIVGTILYFSNMGKFGQGFIIIKATMLIKTGSIDGLNTLRLHLYKNTPSTILDNASFNLSSSADVANYLGYITFDNIIDEGDTLVAQTENLQFIGTTNNNILYGYIETLDIFTPPTNLEIEVRLFGVDT